MLAAMLVVLAGSFACSPTLAAGERMFRFTVVRKDTLSNLSRELLVSPNAWREVSRINKLRNPNQLRPGQVPVSYTHLTLPTILRV